MVEAKPFESAPVGMLQLLIYVAAVFEARIKRMKRSIFGLLSDGKAFYFWFLNNKKKILTIREYR